jgi:hypothetical protein
MNIWLPIYFLFSFTKINFVQVFSESVRPCHARTYLQCLQRASFWSIIIIVFSIFAAFASAADTVAHLALVAKFEHVTALAIVRVGAHGTRNGRTLFTEAFHASIANDRIRPSRTTATAKRRGGSIAFVRGSATKALDAPASCGLETAASPTKHLEARVANLDLAATAARKYFALRAKYTGFKHAVIACAQRRRVAAFDARGVGAVYKFLLRAFGLATRACAFCCRGSRGCRNSFTICHMRR